MPEETVRKINDEENGPRDPQENYPTGLHPSDDGVTEGSKQCIKISRITGELERHIVNHLVVASKQIHSIYLKNQSTQLLQMPRDNL
jgi:hypothetical protein